MILSNTTFSQGTFIGRGVEYNTLKWATLACVILITKMIGGWQLVKHRMKTKIVHFFQRLFPLIIIHIGKINLTVESFTSLSALDN